MKKILVLLFSFVLLQNFVKAQPCHASFRYNINGSMVKFIDSSNTWSGLYSFLGTYFDFGNGNQYHFNQSGDSISVTFSPGVYNVCLRLYDSVNNCRDSFCQSITIVNATGNCSTSFTTSLMGGGLCWILHSSAVSSGYISYDSSYIDFGDGIVQHNGITQGNLVHNFISGGSYLICLKIYDSITSCSDIFCQNTFIPYWGCSTNYNVSNFDSIFFFSGNTVGGIGPVNYQWTIYDSVTNAILYSGTSPNPFVVDSAYHSMMVALQSTDSVGCVSTYSSNYYVGNGGSGGNGFCNAFFTLYPDTTTPHKYWGYNLSTGVGQHYIWNWDDGSYDTIPYPIHIYSSSAFYNIVLTAWSNIGGQYCIDSFEYNYFINKQAQANTIYSVEILSPTGINKIEPTNSLKIYPNPASTELTINLKGEKIESTKVISINGQLMLQNNSSVSKINITELPANIYFIVVKTTKGIYRSKFVKE